MKKQAKKITALVLALMLLLSAATVINVGADSKKTVSVTVQNVRMSAEDGAPWTGILVDREIELKDDDSMESVIERAIALDGYNYTVSPYGYISEINGLAEYAYNGSGGWMATLNDWFTSDGTSAYTVANGGIQAGDENVMMYTCSWGADVGSLYGNFDTSLSVDEFGFRGNHISEETQQEFFVPDIHEYTIEINLPSDVITFFAVPTNKNYQARVYKNDYLPETDGAEYRGGKNVPVTDGDVIYIGVGNPAWPSMNSWGGNADETVYTIHIKYVPIIGDLNRNGRLDIIDVTIFQRHLAEFELLDSDALSIADVNGDNSIDVLDVTCIQKILAEYDI